MSDSTASESSSVPGLTAVVVILGLLLVLSFAFHRDDDRDSLELAVAGFSSFEVRASTEELRKSEQRVLTAALSGEIVETIPADKDDENAKATEKRIPIPGGKLTPEAALALIGGQATRPSDVLGDLVNEHIGLVRKARWEALRKVAPRERAELEKLLPAAELLDPAEALDDLSARFRAAATQAKLKGS